MTFTTLISASELQQLMEQGDLFIADCGFDLAAPEAGREAYASGHIPGARYVHLDEDLSAPMSGSNGRHPLPDPALFAAKLRAEGLRKGQQVIAYDDAGGPYAARLWWLLRWVGHDAVAVLDGGKQAWQALGGGLEQGGAPVPPGDFVAAAPDLATIVDADHVQGNIATGAQLVIDARTPERFRGDPNPLDPVSGHIPGARNRWFKDNLGPDGRFKTPDTLAGEFAAVLAGKAADAAILQCGSGVTACHNALAMAVAGLQGAKLYPGSWSEWITDTSRPVEQGEGRV